jgi:DNA primase
MLFGLERLRELPDGAEMIIAEGETAARALHGCGLHAAGTVCVSGTVPSDAVLRELIRFKCVLWPDADRDGETHMGRIASRLVALGWPSVEGVEWSEAPSKGDAADLIRPFARGRDVEGARVAVETLPRRQWSPLQAGHDHEETLGCGG